MSESVVLTGRGLVGGVAEGEALVTREAISGWGGIEPRKGRVIESRHELVGQSFAGRSWSSGRQGLLGMVGHVPHVPAHGVRAGRDGLHHDEHQVALGVVVTHVPAVTDLDGDPFELIHTGDWVRVDADRGLLTITPQGGSGARILSAPRAEALGIHGGL